MILHALATIILELRLYGVIETQPQAIQVVRVAQLLGVQEPLFARISSVLSAQATMIVEERLHIAI